MQVRGRCESDLDACERLLRSVHESDGYPRRLPSDLRGFIAWPTAICAWVADVDGEVAGHIALHATGSRKAMDLAVEVTGEASGRFGFVARLLVSPHERRQGIGRSLLETARRHAVALALIPALEVTADLAAAIDLYETCGWLRIGTAAVLWRSTGDVADEHIYVWSLRPTAA